MGAASGGGTIAAGGRPIVRVVAPAVIVAASLVSAVGVGAVIAARGSPPASPRSSLDAPTPPDSRRPCCCLLSTVSPPADPIHRRAFSPGRRPIRPTGRRTGGARRRLPRRAWTAAASPGSSRRSGRRSCRSTASPSPAAATSSSTPVSGRSRPFTAHLPEGDSGTVPRLLFERYILAAVRELPTRCAAAQLLAPGAAEGGLVAAREHIFERGLGSRNSSSRCLATADVPARRLQFGTRFLIEP